MEICPSDLGEGFAQQVILRRAKGVPDALHNFLFRTFFGRSMKLPYPVVEKTLENLLHPLTFKRAFKKYSFLLFGLPLGVVAAHYIHPPRIPDSSISIFGFSLREMLGSMSSGGSAIYLFETFRLHKSFVVPLTAYEASEMQNFFNPQQNAPLAYAYLVQEMVQAENIAPAAQPVLRDALRFIGEAVYKLVLTHLPERDTRVITQEIKATEYKEETESDPIVKAVLLREVRSREQALIAARSNALRKRRNDALLSELSVQIEALRVGLPTFCIDNNAGEEQLAILSEKARTVAAEAAAPFHARMELDEAMMVSVGQR